MTPTRIKIALANCSKYGNRARAFAAAERSRYIVPVLLGDDGLFWVPATTREASILQKLGYSVAL